MGEVIRRLFQRWCKTIDMRQDDMDIALDHLHTKGFRPKVVLDIGSAKGYWSLRTGMRFKDAEFFMIDPLSESEEALRTACKKYPRFHYLLMAVGRERGEVIMNVTPDCDGSSALDYPGANPERQRRVPVESIDNLLADGRLKAPDFVKIDVQGFEMQVLEGGLKMFDTAEVFIIEANMYKFMPECPLAHEVILYMANRGFRLYDLAGSLRRPFENDLAQLDLVFVSEKSSLVASNRWA